MKKYAKQSDAVRLQRLGIAAALMSFCLPASAAVIPSLTNSSFEAAALSEGSYEAGDPTGWEGYSNGGSYGSIYPSFDHLAGRDGSNVLFLNVGAYTTFSKVQQNINYTVQAGDIIELSFLIGKTSSNPLPSGEGPFPGYANYDAVLVDNVGTPWVTSSQTNPTLVDGEMLLWSRTYTFEDGDARIGQNLILNAYVSGFVPETGGQVLFDKFDIQLIPEPSSFLLLGTGLVGLAGWRISRRRA